MVKKSTIIFWSILASVDVGLILYSLLAHRDMFLYSSFHAPSVWLALAGLLVVNLFAIGLFYLIQKRHWIISGILTPLCLFVTVIAVFCSVVFGPIACIVSEIDNYDEYIGADARVCEDFKFAGLTLDDITNMEIEKVENFYYYHRNSIPFDLIIFIGKFYFSEQDYESLKSFFSSSKELKETVYSAEEQELYGFTGCYEIDEQEAADGWISLWYECEVKFNDEENAIYFVLDGCIN